MSSIAVRFGAGFKAVQFSTLIGWRRMARASPMLRQMLGSRTVNAYLHRAPEELYDLSKDSHETRNVAKVPRYAATFKELRQRLHDWRKRSNDPWLILNDYKANSQLR
jgi:hypothetical protein